MSLEEFVRLVRRRIVLLVAFVVVLTGLGIAFALGQPAKYSSSSTLILQPVPGGNVSATQSVLTTSGVQTYAGLVNSRQTARSVSQSLGGARTPDQVAASLTAVVPENTFTIVVTAVDSSATMAQQLADNAAQAVSTTANSYLRGPSNSRVGGVTLAVSDPASDAVALGPGRLKRFAVLGFGLGLILGLCAAILAETLGSRVGTDETQVPGAEVLGRIDLRQRRRRFGGSSDEVPAGVESVRRLRTRLALREPRPRTVLLTGMEPDGAAGEVASLLAHASAVAGVDTVLIECDFASPGYAQRYGLQGPGLADVLRETAQVDDVAVPIPLGAQGLDQVSGRLDLVAAGEVGLSADLLGSDLFRKALSRFAHRYDLVLLEGPPLPTSADALALASAADTTILVLRSGRIRRRAALEAVSSLRDIQAQSVGAVLLSTDRPSRRSRRSGRV